ncbi:MAG: NUDIX domain-containing protein [Bdellovibrionales bacterium]
MTDLPLRTFIAAKGVLVYNGRVLFLREAGSYVDGANIGKYDVPGGRLNPDEDVLDGLKREVFEETGCAVTAARPFHVLDWRVTRPSEHWHISAIFFAVPVASDVVKLSQDHDDYVWMDLSKPATIPIMKNYEAMLNDLRVLCGDMLTGAAHAA